MLDFSEKDTVSTREKTFHSYGVFKTSGRLFYKHITPNGVESICLAYKKLFATVTMNDQAHRRFPWRIFFSELIGTALLVFGGLSLVIVMFGSGGPMARLLPREDLRRLITGFLFGTTGALIAVSPVGKESGAHINPVVSFGFRVMRKLEMKLMLVCILAQLIGAAFGALPLLLWKEMGRSVAFGATLPGEGFTTMTVLLGEVVTTFAMVALLAIFLAKRIEVAKLYHFDSDRDGIFRRPKLRREIS